MGKIDDACKTKVTKVGKSVMVLITKKTTNVDMGWAQLKSMVGNVEPLLP